jgi:hypothetical protein
MQYFKIATGKFVQYDESTDRATIILKEELKAQKTALEERIATADPNQPTTNAEWIAWAKSHYPYMDHAAEIAEVDRINTILDAIRNL